MEISRESYTSHKQGKHDYSSQVMNDDLVPQQIKTPTDKKENQV